METEDKEKCSRCGVTLDYSEDDVYCCSFCDSYSNNDNDYNKRDADGD